MMLGMSNANLTVDIFATQRKRWSSLMNVWHTEKQYGLADLMGLEAGPNGTLARRDVETGEQLWRQELSSPALAAFTPTGAEVVLKHAAFPSDAPSGPAPLPGGTLYDWQPKQNFILMLELLGWRPSAGPMPALLPQGLNDGVHRLHTDSTVKRQRALG